MSPEEIDKILGISLRTFSSFKFPQPEKSPSIARWELGRLAKVLVSESAMLRLINNAENHFHGMATPEQREDLNCGNFVDGWSSAFDILMDWCSKTGNNRRVS